MIRRISDRLPAGVRARLMPLWRRLRSRSVAYGALHEEVVVDRLLAQLGGGGAEGVAIDIAACDGVTKSNTLALYERGWRGLAVEGDAIRFADLAHAYRRFPHVALERVWVTPANVVDLLRSAGIPDEPDFLNLDIDSYDHFVLDALLQTFRPRLVCAEINEKIPPPIRFTVTFHEDHVWQGDHFYGQSISALAVLAERHSYSLVELHYNSAFLAPADAGLVALTPEDAYRRGYLERPDRRRLFPWNADMEPLLTLPVDDQLEFLRQTFAKYDGRFELSV